MRKLQFKDEGPAKVPSKLGSRIWVPKSNSATWFSFLGGHPAVLLWKKGILYLVPLLKSTRHGRPSQTGALSPVAPSTVWGAPGKENALSVGLVGKRSVPPGRSCHSSALCLPSLHCSSDQLALSQEAGGAWGRRWSAGPSSPGAERGLWLHVPTCGQPLASPCLANADPAWIGTTSALFAW